MVKNYEVNAGIPWYMIIANFSIACLLMHTGQCLFAALYD